MPFCLFSVYRCEERSLILPKKYRGGTSDATFLFALTIIIIIVLIVVVGHLYSFQPQKQRFLSFENNMGRTDRQMDGPTDGLTDGWMD